MKTQFPIFCAIAFLLSLNHALADQTNFDKGTTTNKSYAVGQAGSKEDYVLGRAESNYGISLGIVLTFNLDFEGDTNIERNVFGYVSYSGGHDPSKYWKYFMGTNCFPYRDGIGGPMELRDSDGKQLPLLKPEVNEMKSYPIIYSIKAAMHMHPPRRQHDYPYALVPRSGTTVELPTFYLEDYFKLEKPGDYQLTIWPKIYKRVAPGSDICERIDLPPVTIPFKWNNGLQK